MFKNLFWAIMHRFHPDHRYNTMTTGLPPGYYDPDVQILYGVMNTFAQYWKTELDSFGDGCIRLEREKYAEWFSSEEEIKEYEESVATDNIWRKELTKIYHWWVYRYLPCVKSVENYYTGQYADMDDERRQMYEEWLPEHLQQLENEADDMLARLMKYRQKLWYL
jgi:hypothetical protein